jgi:hypothetical protein
MTWIIANWRLIAIGLIISGILYIGWHAHTLEDKVAENASLTAENARLAAIPPKIIHDTQVITKVIHDAKDKCTDSVVPSAINKQLR